MKTPWNSYFSSLDWKKSLPSRAPGEGAFTTQMRFQALDILLWSIWHGRLPDSELVCSSMAKHSMFLTVFMRSSWKPPAMETMSYMANVLSFLKGTSLLSTFRSYCTKKNQGKIIGFVWLYLNGEKKKSLLPKQNYTTERQKDLLLLEQLALFWKLLNWGLIFASELLIGSKYCPAQKKCPLKEWITNQLFTNH